MPFINVRVAGHPLGREQVDDLQKGVTSLMAETLGKVGPLIGVLVEQMPPGSWSVGAAVVPNVAHVDAVISAGSNTPEQKAKFIDETYRLLRTVLGADLAEVSYVVLRETPKDSWGYGGLTQEHRARQQA